MELKEPELFEYLKEFHYSDLEKSDEFDTWEDACNQGTEWIVDAVIEKTESDEQ